VAKFGRKVYSRIFEIDVEKWLFGVPDSDFVLGENVLSHGHLLAVSLNKAVCVRILFPVETINLVGFRVVGGDDSLTRNI
jgi:hypothetical protein